MEFEFDVQLWLQLREWENIFEVIHYRGRIAFENNISFIIHSNEQGHNKPHIHAQYQNKEIVIEIPTGVILAGYLPNNKAKQASDWVMTNAEMLKQKWNDFTNGIKIPVI